MSTKLEDCPDIVFHLVYRKLSTRRDFNTLLSYSSEYGFDAYLLKGKTYGNYYLVIDDVEEPAADTIVVIYARTDEEAEGKARDYIRNEEASREVG